MTNAMHGCGEERNDTLVCISFSIIANFLKAYGHWASLKVKRTKQHSHFFQKITSKSNKNSSQ